MKAPDQTVTNPWLLAISRAATVLAFSTTLLLVPGDAMSAGEKVFRTGIKAFPRYFSVAPGGEGLIFDVSKPADGLHLIDLTSGKTSNIPAEAGRIWDMGSWSPDGKSIVAVSTGWTNRQYDLDDVKIILVNPRDWSWQVISPATGNVKITPFFSPDGRNIYYFSGEKRTEGATLASGFDLYSIHLDTGREEKLTDNRFYQVAAGDVSADGKIVFFSRLGGRPIDSQMQKSASELDSMSQIVSIDVERKKLQIAHGYNKAAFVEISRPRFDTRGRLYFFGITHPKGKPFVYSVFRSGRLNEPAQQLADASNWSRFDIAKRSGEIFVSDTRDGEVIFRRIAVGANE